jgi:hypothetical protein
MLTTAVVKLTLKMMAVDGIVVNGDSRNAAVNVDDNHSVNDDNDGAANIDSHDAEP